MQHLTNYKSLSTYYPEDQFTLLHFGLFFCCYLVIIIVVGFKFGVIAIVWLDKEREEGVLQETRVRAMAYLPATPNIIVTHLGQVIVV